MKKKIGQYTCKEHTQTETYKMKNMKERKNIFIKRESKKKKKPF